MRRENRIKKIDVKIGAIDGKWAEVLDGDIATTDDVVVRRK